MTDITLRIPKGSPITFEEMDSNLLALDSDTPFKVSDGHVTYEGKIGVGVDSTYRPTYQLDLGSGDSNNEATIGTADADLHVHVDGPRSLKVSTNTQERLTLTTQGNLGINQPNPEFPLDIDGNARITGTFRGNQFRAFSFSDSADLTISNGSITNAKRIVSTNQIDFSRLYDRQTGYKVDHIDSVMTADSAALGLPTTKAVYDAMESDRTALALNMDSEHLWNLGEHQSLQTNVDSVRVESQTGLDSQHAYNTNQFSTIQFQLDSQQTVDRENKIVLGERIDSLGELTFSVLDSEHAWNVAEHNQLQSNIDSVNDALIAQGTARHDSEHAWNVARHDSIHASLDSEHAWNVTEHNQLQTNLDAETQARTDADSDINSRLDSEHAWNVTEHNILQSQFDNLTTDSVAEGDINLYYTNARVDARNDSTIDSNFLNNRMPLGNLSDVQLTPPDLNEVLQWNGSVWSNQSIGIVGTIEFRGTVDATTDAAPAGPSNGDFYINLGGGTALASWTGLSTVDSGDGLAWDSNATNWRNLGKTSSASVVKVLAGTAISVDETDTARPVVAVRKDVTDTWYYTQSQVDSAILVERNWNISEHDSLQSNINAEATARENADSDLSASLSASLDSEHAWNVLEHGKLDSSLEASHNQLQVNINNLDSSVNERLDSLQLYVDNVVDINIGNLDSDLTILQEYVDSFVAVEIAKLDSALDSEHAWNVREHGKLDSALDSEHAWNVAEHYSLDSDLRAALDSLGENITAGLIISEDPPTDPSDGDLWMSTTEETVYIYDGEFWFEFPGTGNTYASLAIGDTAPNEPSQGTMWMDNTEGVVKIYDGDYWFDWPWPDIEAGDLGFLDSSATQGMIDSAIDNADRFTLQLAADGTRGGVQTGYAANGKNYPVQLSSEKMYVNVPWTDTTYALATSGALGLVKIGYSANGKNYPVALSNGQMYVNVPWTDTVYTAPTTINGGTY